MFKENNKKNKHKSPKFKESYDEDFCWEDLKEIQSRKKKTGKRSQRKSDIRDKW